MKVAIVCSNVTNVGKESKNGTAIFNYILIENLSRFASEIDVTAFTSGASQISVNKQDVGVLPSSENESIMEYKKHELFELALLSKAFSQQDTFDIYHINIGSGDIAMPFIPFVKRPVIVTLHYAIDTDFIREYFSLFKKYDNVYFVSASDAQRKLMPDLNYVKTIYHGIEDEEFSFDPVGGETMMWAGRMVPEKGMDKVVYVVNHTQKQANLFALRKKEYQDWFEQDVKPNLTSYINLAFDQNRHELIEHFKKSKLFLFPVGYEESFGLVLTEAMSCGTPVVAFAKGSIPEIVKDGETGFIVNESDDDIRGDWIIKKTGTEGLIEAVQRIYSLSPDEYSSMRQACRTHVEKNFSVKKMINEYVALYKKLTD